MSDLPNPIIVKRFSLKEVSPDFYEIDDRHQINPIAKIRPDGHGMPSERLDKARQLVFLLNYFDVHGFL